VKLPFQVRPILACGAELKNTFCVTRDEYAFLSQHIGDMENLETLEHFETTIELYKQLFRIDPEIIACDMHPEYLATKYARSQIPSPKSPISNLHSPFAVQHHHAHIASCLADNSWSPDDGPVIGVAWDGTGYGTDGNIWGGEFLVADYYGFRRVAHLEYLPMPGGEAAIRNPYRLAIGYLYALTGQLPSDVRYPPLEPSVDEEELRIIQRQIDRGINCPQTSAGGRLFDAVSALLGIRERATYEAQAAIELEMAAQSSNLKSQISNRKSRISNLKSQISNPAYPFDIEQVDDGGSRASVIRLRKLFEALLADRRSGASVGEMAYRFHVTVAEMMRATCERIAQETGLRTVALSGGCFQNRLLLALAVPRLQEVGLRVIMHRRVPCNDGGVSLGQAVIAHFAVEHGMNAGDSE
jgi:hydrogenase maturation protein HypF